MDKAYWNEIAQRYDAEIFSVFSEDRNKKLNEYLDKYANRLHLAIDFGCGIGRAFDYLSPRFREVMAIDFSQKLLDIARMNASPNVALQQVDLTKAKIQLPLADFGFCCNVAMLPDTVSNLMIFKNIQKFLKPGGKAIIVVPSLESVMYKSWLTVEWFRKEGVAFEEIPAVQWQDFKFGKKSFINGLVSIAGVITKHYLQSELMYLLSEANLRVMNMDKLEYGWKSEFESPPAWMKAPYPWDWLAECEKMN